MTLAENLDLIVESIQALETRDVVANLPNIADEVMKSEKRHVISIGWLLRRLLVLVDSSRITVQWETSHTHLELTFFVCTEGDILSKIDALGNMLKGSEHE